jgi:serine/threonine protein kinase
MSPPSASSSHDATVIRLKKEFDRKFREQEVSGSSEKLKEYKFLAVLGQGAFGLVVIYHSSFFSLHFPLFLRFSHSNGIPCDFFLCPENNPQKLVKHEPAEQFYAVKIIKKERVVKTKQVKHTISEKQILHALDYPFVVCLEFSLKDNSYLYLGMPFINGGEMFHHLRK